MRQALVSKSVRLLLPVVAFTLMCDGADLGPQIDAILRARYAAGMRGYSAASAAVQLLTEPRP